MFVSPCGMLRLGFLVCGLFLDRCEDRFFSAHTQSLIVSWFCLPCVSGVEGLLGADNGRRLALILILPEPGPCLLP